MTPLIGITAYVEVVRTGDWLREVTYLPQQYVTAVHAAGGRAVVLPPAVEGADRVIAALDGLLLAGGADLDPGLYAAPADPATVGVRPDRDAGENALLAAAAEAELPVLGVCRGMQLMVAAAGGTLHQDLPAVVGHQRHRAVPGEFGTHPVRTVAGSRLHALLGPDATVPSYHHQGVADAGALDVSAHADDGTIEAVEHGDGPFWLGVLWHPEAGSDPRLFEALVEAARVPVPH
jgi:putative glutamine amidotransferase